MNVLVVDTSSWISYFRNFPIPDLDLALKEGRVFLPVVVAAELLSANERKSELDKLAAFLKELPLCDSSFEHWQRVGELRRLSVQKGIKISIPDAHIAQCCLDLEGYLLSEDQVFTKLAKISALRLMR